MSIFDWLRANSGLNNPHAGGSKGGDTRPGVLSGIPYQGQQPIPAGSPLGTGPQGSPGGAQGVFDPTQYQRQGAFSGGLGNFLQTAFMGTNYMQKQADREMLEARSRHRQGIMGMNDPYARAQALLDAGMSKDATAQLALAGAPLANTAKLHGMMVAQKGATRAQAADDRAAAMQKVTQDNIFRDDFRQEALPIAAAINQSEKVQNLVQGKKIEDLSRADDEVLLNALAKMTRPGEALMSDDVARITARTLGGEVEFWQRWMVDESGQLDDTQRKEILQTISNMTSTLHQQYTRIRTYDEAARSNVGAPGGVYQEMPGGYTGGPSVPQDVQDRFNASQ